MRLVRLYFYPSSTKAPRIVNTSAHMAVSSDGGDASSKASEQKLQDAFARCQDELLGTLYHLVGDREDACDALQDTFVKCWRNRHKVDEIENLKAWIFRIALNTGRDLRQAAWRRRKKALGEEEGMLESRSAGPQDRAQHDEQVERLRAAVSQLRAEEQEVFLLRQNAQMTYEEIAEALKLPSGTVKTRMRLALNKLREKLAE